MSVAQRPPIRSAASITMTLRFAAITRRAAAMPAAPAPITTISASRGIGAALAANGRINAAAAEPAISPRRVIVMTTFLARFQAWFPDACQTKRMKVKFAVLPGLRQLSW